MAKKMLRKDMEDLKFIPETDPWHKDRRHQSKTQKN